MARWPAKLPFVLLAFALSVLASLVSLAVCQKSLGKEHPEALERHGEADRAFQELVRLEPTWQNYLEYAEFKFKSMSLREAEKLFHLVLEHLSGGVLERSTESAVLTRLAVLCYLRGANQEAETYFSRAEQLNPDDPILQQKEAIYWESQCQVQKAEAAFARCLRLEPKLVYQDYGKFLLVHQRYLDAEGIFRRAVEDDPKSAWFRMRLAEALQQQNKHEEAVEVLKSCEQICNDSQELYWRLGKSLAAVGRSGEAEAAFQHSLQLGQTYMGCYSYAELLQSLGKKAEANEMLAKAAQIGPPPDEAAAVLSKAQVLQESSGDYKAVLEDLRRGECALKTNPEFFWRLALSLQAVGSSDEAVAAFQRSLEIKTTFSGCYYYARLLFDQHRGQEAQDLLRRAGDPAEKDVPAILAVASVRQSVGEYAEVVPILHRASELSPNNSTVFGKLAVSLEFSGHSGDADAAFAKAVELKASSFATYYHNCFGSRRPPGFYENLCRQALRADPENADLLDDLAIIIGALDRWEEAADVAGRALQLRDKNKEDPWVELAILIGADLVTGKQEDAIRMVSALADNAQSNAQSPDLWFTPFLYHTVIAVLRLQQDAYQKATESAAQALTDYNSPEFADDVEASASGYNESAKAQGVDFKLIHARLLTLQGKAAFHLRRFEDAIPYYQKAIDELERLPNRSESESRAIDLQPYDWTIEALGGIAKVYEAENDYAAAIATYEKALTISKKNGAVRQQLENILSLLYAFRHTGQFERAAQALGECGMLLDRLQDEEGRDKYLAALAKYRGEYKEIIDYSRKRLEAAKSKGRPLPVAESLADLAEAMKEVGQYEEALQAYNQAIQIRQEPQHRSPAWVAFCQRKVAEIYRNIGDYKKARQWLNESSTTWAQIGRKERVAETLTDQAALENQLGNFDQALSYLETAKGLYQDLKNLVGEADTLDWQGLILEGQKRYGEALQDFEDALKQERRTDDTLSTARSLRLIGREHALLGERAKGDQRRQEFAEAERKMQEALAIERSANLSGSEIQQSIAELRLREERFSEAEQLLIEIANKDAKTEYPSNWEAWHLLGSAEAGLGKNEEAVKDFKQSIEIIEKRRQVTAGTTGELNFLQQYHEVYQSLIELLIKTENLPEAYDYIELQKVTELQQGALPRGPADDSQGAAFRKGRSLQFSEIAIEREIADEGKKDAPDKMRIANLEKLRKVINQEFVEFLHELEVSGQTYALVRQQLLANPRELYRSIHDLPEDVFVIQPVLLSGQKKIVILVYHRGVPIKREVSIRDAAEVRELIDKFLNYLSEQPSASSPEEAARRLARIREIGSRLYQWLIAPIADQLGSARLLVISPSGNLRKIPFQALYDGNKFLIETYPIVTLGLGSGPAGSVPKKLNIFAVADPDGTLPGTEDQVLKLKEIFPDARVLCQRDATKASLEWGEMEKKYNVLVFATHCQIDDDKPTASFIQLAGKGEDKKLTYDEIGGFGSVWEPGPYQSNGEWTGVSLAVLSACSTAVDLTTEDWAVQGFAAQFELIGVSWVAASLWPVEDHSTTELMNGFFQNLQNGKSMAESLQTAQVALIHSINYSDPFYWSPFILIGDWR